MPETYINDYELAQIPCGKDSREDISFTLLKSDLGEGAKASVLYGANTGNRTFSASHKLQGWQTSATITYNGQTFTPENYLWDLYCRSQVTGTPFVVQSTRNDQYYLVEFADEKLSYERMLTKYYTTGMNLRQVRRPGVSVFDIAKLTGITGWHTAESLTGQADDSAVIAWEDVRGSGFDLGGTGAPTYQENEINGKPVVRFNGTSSYFAANQSINLMQFFIVLKINAATFPNFAGILSNTATATVLVGQNGSTNFVNNAFGDGYVYRKNGIAFDETAQAAPMNTFAVVQLRFRDGINLSNPVVGKDRNLSSRFAAMDVAEMVWCNNHFSDTDGRELTEHFIVKYGL